MLGYFQPVEIKAPPGALVSLASAGRFEPSRRSPDTVGLLIGQVYRMRVSNLPLHPDLELYPTIELIDRLYPPAGEARRFAIPVELSRQDLELALEGKFVTRVIYLENPRQVLPVAETPGEQAWYDVGPGQDPLAAADALGRPVAILRLGGRVPENTAAPDVDFLFGCPPWQQYPLATAMLPPRKAAQREQP